MISDYVRKAIRSAAILTTSYVAGTVIGAASDYNRFYLLVNFTKGSLDSAEFKVEFSNDGTTYYQEVASSITGGTDTNTLKEHQIAASGKYMIDIPFKANYIKVSVKGTGTVTGSSMAAEGILGVV